MNTIAFHGNIVEDAKVRDAGDFKVLEVRVADNVGFGDKQVTNFFKVVKFQKTDPKKLADMLVKGKSVFISGEFKAVPYKDKNGNDRLGLEVNANNINLIGGRDPSSEQSDSKEYSAPASKTSKAKPKAEVADTEEDMPF